MRDALKGKSMSDEPVEYPVDSRVTTTINPADLAAHVAKVKAAWREHERAMTWEQKIAAIERMRERGAQLDRARQVAVMSTQNSNSAP